MTGKEIQKLILSWFDEHYPTWMEDWIEPGFDSYIDLPLEIKMVPAFLMLEHDMINGGWAQALWNSFGNWRELIEIARAGYKLIGGASEQLSALNEFYVLCESNETECEEAIAREDGTLKSFGEFTKRSYLASGNKWEMALWPGTSAYWKRLDWLEKNESHIRITLGRLTPTDQ